MKKFGILFLSFVLFFAAAVDEEVKKKLWELTCSRRSISKALQCITDHGMYKVVEAEAECFGLIKEGVVDRVEIKEYLCTEGNEKDVKIYDECFFEKVNKFVEEGHINMAAAMKCFEDNKT